MKRLNHAFTVLLTVSLFLLAGGCRHKLLDDDPVPTIRVRVEYDWRNAPGASPTSMGVFFYNPESGRYHRFDFVGCEGGTVTLEPGRWHVLSYNTDTPGILFSSEKDFFRHAAYTRDGNVLEGALGNALAPSMPRAETRERVVITPDMLWGCTSPDHMVEVDRATGEALVTLYPSPLVCHYSYEIRNVSNIDHVSKACGILSGMAGALAFHNEQLDSECVTLPFPSRCNSDGTITGEFYTFGHHEANEEPHLVTLYVWMDDGRKLAYGTTRTDRWDVTEQIHAAPDRRRVHFIIDGLDIPVMTGSGGFSPSTDDWGEEEVEVEIPM